MLKLDCCNRTVLNDIKANGGKLYHMQKGPIQMPGDQAARTAWGTAQLKDPSYGVTSVFCDEKLFGLSQKGLKIEHVYPGQQRRHRAVAHTEYVNMFAAIGPGGKLFLKRIPKPSELGPRHYKHDVARAPKNPNETRGRKRLNPRDRKQRPRKGMDSEAFIDHILGAVRKFYRHNNFKLVVDNATPHISKMTIAWCQRHKLTLVRLSPRSPDINIVENVWSALETAVWKLGMPKNLDELEKRIISEGQKLDLSHLYTTIRPRTAEVVDRSGKLLDGGWRKSENRRKKKHLLSLA
jgi:hypothetical protein